MSSFEDELNRSGTLCWTNVGVSMMPLLRQRRDVMLLQRRGEERCRKYDAVLFKRRNGQYVLHRILKVRPHDYWIVGDNCFRGEYVQEDQILAVMTGLVRDGKTISVSDKKYLCYVHLWCDFWPVRFALLRLRTYCAAILHKLR